MPSGLVLQFLGLPQVLLDDRPVSTERRKAIALLAYMAVNDIGRPRQRYSRETLSALLWPDYDQAKAFSNLRTIIWELRQAIGEGWLMADRESVHLNLDAEIDLDVARFQELLSQSRRQNDPAPRIPFLVEATKLYRDHFLTGFSLKDAPSFNEWAFAEAEDLRRKLAEALIFLSEDYCALGQADQAIPYARRLVTLDPLNESAHRQLMEVYLQAGQHSAALKQYQLCEQILRKELGVDPQPETYALYKKIRKGEIKPVHIKEQIETIPPKKIAEKPLPTGTVTFVFTDIEGSTKLAQQYPDAIPALVARHHEILNQSIQAHNGYAFQIVGDSFCAAFHSASDALNAALNAQRLLQNEAWSPVPIKVRMGIHTGAAQFQGTSKALRYSGYATIALTQRIMSAGHGGQVLLSQATQELVHDELPEGVDLRDMGEWQLKDALHPMRLYQLVIHGLPADFAPLKSTPAITSTEDTTASMLDRIVRGKLIGRERELMDANVCWQKTIAGEGQALLISGEPGVGKTRFTRELVNQLKFSGATVLVGECYAEGGAPYAPIAQIIQDAFTQSPSLPNSLPQYVLADILTLAPSLSLRYPDVPTNQLMDTETDQERIFDSVLELCARLSLRTPLMLFLDDAHWSDAGTLYLLRHLARRSRAALQKSRPRLMIAMTYREVELDEARSLNEVILDLNRERIATRIKLPRLTIERTRDMLGVMFAEEITPEFLAGIYRETEGNPFFIEEVCKTLIESGKLTYADGRWHRPSMDEMEIPQSLRLAIQARVGRLSSQTQEALTLASIIGREFEFEILLQASEYVEDSLIESLESAMRAQLIEEVKGRGEELYTFVHALIPTTLYEGVSARRRKRAHERVAHAIERISPNDFESLAHHYAAADDSVKVVEYSWRAAKHAESLYAYDTAIHHLRAALEFVETDEPELRRMLQEKLADILSFIHEGVEAVPLYQGFLSSLKADDDPLHEVELRIHRKIIRAISDMNRWEDIQRFESVSQENEAAGLRLIENQPPHVETVQFLTELSMQAWLHRVPQDWGSAEHFARQAVEMAEQLGDPIQISDALNALSNAYGGRGLFRERVELELRRLELSRDPRFTDTNKRVNLLGQAGAALVYVGEYD